MYVITTTILSFFHIYVVVYIVLLLYIYNDFLSFLILVYVDVYIDNF